MLRRILNENPRLMNIAAGVYNLAHYNNALRFRRNNRIRFRGAFLKRARFSIHGRNNEIIIGAKARINNCSFTIYGDNCRIIIGGNHTIVSNASFWCQHDGSKIIIGDNFTMEGGHIASTEGCSITIGDDCMFANDIEIRNGDSHSMLDATTGLRINPAADVVIGNHVWLTAHVRVLKGSHIPHSSIVANSALVTGEFETPGVLLAGIPCRPVRDNVTWDRYLK